MIMIDEAAGGGGEGSERVDQTKRERSHFALIFLDSGLLVGIGWMDGWPTGVCGDFEIWLRGIRPDFTSDALLAKRLGFAEVLIEPGLRTELQEPGTPLVIQWCARLGVPGMQIVGGAS